MRVLCPSFFLPPDIYNFSAMVTLRSEKIIRKRRDVFINPNVLCGAHAEALHSRKTLGRWTEDAIGEKIDRKQKKLK